ncbi:hypothetical protein I4I73_15650 [Pseudonocardia sp. KRD-184]|uniref:Integrase catalytic domain-containing protein n=1 Tax=Pseudonocardia oceani TaxID=2792013 RepID=A0ABS6U8B0_9PSEU|nr:hypothetical protein [Pseudonocardia oceani]MBW0097417.1 hypothetical protein [Pseudonocardia oceani]MBW0124188.1 hypothetical protein [Pseudonocardia oceani]MBW0128482.1 hypothetical protein [Pseudonocardia oceani]
MPFQIEKVRTDNGAKFQSSFHRQVLDHGIGTSTSGPPHRVSTAKVERSHRIDAEEFYRLLGGAVIDNASVFNDKLEQKLYAFGSSGRARGEVSVSAARIATRPPGVT